MVRLGGGVANVDQQLDPTNGTNQLFMVTDATPSPDEISGNDYSYRLLIRPGDSATTFSANSYYRIGQAIFQSGRVQRSKRAEVQTTYDGAIWENSFPMLPDARGVELGRTATAPTIVLDKDLSDDPTSLTLGIDLNNDVDYLAQLRSGADFQGIARFMSAIGYSEGDIGLIGSSIAGTVMEPQLDESLRNWNPATPANPAASPSGKLSGVGSWPLEFNRPSLIRAFGQAYEWAGQSNYTKAMPKYQVSRLTDQHKVDYFAVNHLGGRVYNTGFNEDGLLVQGDTIRDLSTGRVTNTEVAGLGGLSGDPAFENFPTVFEDLTVTNEFINGGRASLNNVVLNGDIQGSPTWAVGVLPEAGLQTTGIIRTSSGAEITQGVVDDAAVTPDSLRSATGVAFGLVPLDSNVKIDIQYIPDIDISLLPQATTESPGIVELATDAELTTTFPADRVVTPASIDSTKNQALGLAVVEAGGKLPISIIPGIGLDSLPLTPIPWDAASDPFTNINFTYTYNGACGSLDLGTPNTVDRVGRSGFIWVTNSTGNSLTGLDPTIWVGVTNTWFDPNTRQQGLFGDLLIAYYVQSESRIMYNVNGIT